MMIVITTSISSSLRRPGKWLLVLGATRALGKGTARQVLLEQVLVPFCCSWSAVS